MNIASLLIGTIISQILFVITKILFINYLNIDSWLVMTIFFVALILETIAVSRRMGTLNYIESFFLAAVWLIVSLLVDLVITNHFVGGDVYKTIYFWVIYPVIVLSVILFHKKLHVEVRKANANK